jgi:hypothetical protein
MGTQVPWESVTAFVALGAFGYSCTAILGYDDVVFEGEGEGAGAGAGAAGAGQLDTNCIPSEGNEPVADKCGLFVSAKLGDDVDGDGSKARPLRTVSKALQRGDVLYTCAGDVIDEAVVVDGEATLFGGLDCDSGWAFASGSKTTWTAPAGSVPLHVAEGGRAHLRDMTLTARDAASPGGSSIAVIAGPKSTLDLARCDVVAGDAKDGAGPSEVAGEGLSGMEGGKGTVGCLDLGAAIPPGLGGQHVCGLLDVGGGSGGPGLLGSAGADGSDGSPAVGGQTSGDGGKKQDVTDCTAGHAGAAGAAGEPGAGAKGLGSLGVEGFTGIEGADGAAGKPGQGGGGGGGAKKCGNGKAGPSGGGGGSGACGGAGGRGGGAGGASIGIVSLDATLTLTEVSIRTGNGGKGSAGAPGGSGGDGAPGGPPGAGDSKAKACAGGKGGDGGKGGRGGGGRGGHSIGVAHLGAAPLLAGVELQLGTAGDGGQGEGLAGDGAPGVSAAAQGFD